MENQEIFHITTKLQLDSNHFCTIPIYYCSYLAYFVHTNTLQLMKVVTLTIVITHYLILLDL